MTETFELWHQELSAELKAARLALPSLEAEVSAAADAAGAAERALREVRAAIAQIARPSGLITGRLQDFETARSTASGRQTRAAGCLQVARDRIKELETALRQLDQVIAPAVEDAA